VRRSRRTASIAGGSYRARRQAERADGHGRAVDFRHTGVVMTSNLGSQRIQALSGEGYKAMNEAVMEVVGRHVRPEFVNRVDEMVVFHPLGTDPSLGCMRSWNQ
jgi:ATP-dependent Clp protease ATP-binding subunit ClpA